MPKDIAELRQELADLEAIDKVLEAQQTKWTEVRDTEQAIRNMRRKVHERRRFITDMGEKPEA